MMKFLLLSLLLFPLWLGGCTSSVNLNEVANHFAEEKYLKKTGLEENRFANHMLLEDSLALFVVVKPNQAPKSLSPILEKVVAEELQLADFYTKIFESSSIQKQVKQSPKFRQKSQVYFNSLSFIAVSDRDISNPLGKYLKSDQFFLLQLDQWPCSDCEVQLGLRLKARLVDASSGEILWTGISERILFEGESEDVNALTVEMTRDLVRNFYYRFRPKWHQQRLEGLRSLRDAS